MSRLTQPLYNHIALAFDFDETLAPDSYDKLIEWCGLDADKFDRERIRPLVESGWEEIPAKFYSLIRESKHRAAGGKITRDSIAAFSRELQPYEGVEAMFDGIRSCVGEMDPDVEVEFYIVSSGIVDIVRGMPMAANFKAIWGCEFAFAPDGEIEFVKRIVSHVEKNRYLYQISKGINNEEHTGGAFEVYRDVSPSDLHVPFTQMIYVGDGSSDLPAFSLMHEQGGVAIGVYQSDTPAEWESGSELTQSQRVGNLTRADYGEESELMQSLRLAVEKICKQIALRRLSVGE